MCSIHKRNYSGYYWLAGVGNVTRFFESTRRHEIDNLFLSEAARHTPGYTNIIYLALGATFYPKCETHWRIFMFIVLE